MNNNYYRGNVLVRRLVTCMDIVILNVLLFAYTRYGAELVPDYFDQGRRIKLRCPPKVLTGTLHPIQPSIFSS